MIFVRVIDNFIDNVAQRILYCALPRVNGGCFLGFMEFHHA